MAEFKEVMKRVSKIFEAISRGKSSFTNKSELTKWDEAKLANPQDKQGV